MNKKPMMSSKTIRVGTVYISVGVLLGILQLFDMLEPVLVSINAEEMPPGAAGWGGLVLAIIGGVQVWLRMVTSQPIGDKPPEVPEPEDEPEDEANTAG